MTPERGKSILATDALTLEGIEASYGDAPVLHGISFTLRHRRLLGLLGRNGAGKTSTMSTIVGLLRASSGSLRVLGREMRGCSPETIANAGVALVPQGRRIFRSLSVQENLSVAARRGVDGSRDWTIQRVHELFPILSERRSQLAGNLSGGEQQMLAIGRALMSNPKVLLMDEPSEGLAPQIVKKVVETIRYLKEAGLSIVLVEQNVSIALDLVDDVVVLNTGRVALVTTGEDANKQKTEIEKYLGIF
ncbi:branched-chain amino acid transport system ATP-binding protein [Nitrobacteraceae bacterium AZCC 2161]